VYTEALLRCLVKSVSSAATHATTARKRSNRVLARLSLDARVLIQRALVYVYVTHILSLRHTHIPLTSRPPVLLFSWAFAHTYKTRKHSRRVQTSANTGKCWKMPISQIWKLQQQKKTILNPAAEFFHIIWFRPIYNFLRYSVHRQRDKQTNTRRWSQYFANLAGRGVDYSWKTDLKPLLWWIKIYIYWRIIVRFSLRLVDFILKNSISMFIILGLK